MTKKSILNQLKSITVGTFLACGSLVIAEEAIVKQIVVDDNKAECPSAQFTSIQEAINSAASGSEIRVCAGIYKEQLSITKSLNIRGESGSVLTPKGMQINAENLAMYEDISAVVSVKGAKDVRIEGLTIDGKNNGISNCSAELAGIVYEDAAGEVKGVTVTNIKLDSSSSESCMSTYGIFVQSSDDGEADVTISESTIQDCNSAIVGNNLGTIVRANGNTINAAGAGANGLELAFGAIGTSKDNSVAAVQ